MPRRRPSPDQTLTFMVRSACLVIILAGLHYSKPVLAPLVVSTLLAFTLTPLANVVERRVRFRSAAISIVVIMVVGAAVAVSWFVVNQMSMLQEQWPQYSHNIRERVVSVYDQVQTLKQEIAGSSVFAGKLIQGDSPKGRPASAAQANAQPPAPPEAPVPIPIFERLSSLLFSLLSYLVFILTVSVFTIFLLIGRRDIRDRWIRFIGGDDIPGTTRVVDETSRKVGRYLGAQLTVNIIFGTALASALWLIGIPQPLLWGAVSVVLRFVPFIGGFLSASAPILLSLAVDPTWSTPLYTFSAYLVIDLSISQAIEPVFIGRQVGVSGFALLLAAAFWTATWDITGLIISTPVTVCLVSLGRYVRALNFMAILCGDDEVMEPRERMYHRLLSNDLNDVQELLRSSVAPHTDRGMWVARALDTLVFPAMATAKRDFDENRLAGSEYRVMVRRLTAELGKLSPDTSSSSEVFSARRNVRVCVIELNPEEGPLTVLLRRALSSAGYRIISAPSRFKGRAASTSAREPSGTRVLVLVGSDISNPARIARRARFAARLGAGRTLVFALPADGNSGAAPKPATPALDGTPVHGFPVAASAESLVNQLDGRSPANPVPGSGGAGTPEAGEPRVAVSASTPRLSAVKIR